jgi:predicted DCC family thiol-disulfide oxidoreductase YuxK
VSELESIGDRLLVIFDGRCGLCNRSIRWFLVHDRRDRLRFAAYESPKVAALLDRHGLGASRISLDPDTILVAVGLDSPAERLLLRSDGVLAILSELPSPWPSLAAAMKWIPRPLRDLAYRLIARFRYRIWGRLDTCPIPTAAERIRFL